MSFRGLRVLAVVPARGGSKSVPRKNLCVVRGLSLIARAARAIHQMDLVDCALCSTDDVEIAAEARRHGLMVPRMRPPDMATDDAKSVDAWRYEWLEQEHLDGMTYDVSILVQPTSPLRHAEDLVKTLAKLVDTGARAATTVSRTPGDYTPHKTLTIRDDGRIEFFMPGGAQYSRRQDIPTYYHRNGICYAAWRNTVVERRMIVEEDCAAVVIDRPTINIDEPHDLMFAEALAAQEPW